MRRGVVDKHVWILRGLLLIGLPAVSWYLTGIPGVVVGLILALLLDGFLPKWTSNLKWRDVELALHNLYDYGYSGSTLCFRLAQKRRVYIYRDEKGDPIRMGIKVPLANWNDFFTDSQMKDIGDTFGGWWFFEDSTTHKCLVYFPAQGRKGCLDFLRWLITHSDGELHDAILARVNCAKKNIWRKHTHEV